MICDPNSGKNGKDDPSEQAPGRNGKGQFVPGSSGNPAGRRKGVIDISAIFRKKLKEAAREGDQTRAEALAETWLKMAEDGEIAPFKEIFDRVDPKVHKQELSVDPDAPVEINIIRTAKNDWRNKDLSSDRPPSLST